MPEEKRERALEDLVFLGFNSRVLALDRYSGEVVWEWKSPKGSSSYVALLLDEDRLIVSVQGYTYCLEPLSGAPVWENRLKGYGLGIPCLASIHGNSGGGGTAKRRAKQREAAAAAGGAGAAGGG